VRHVVAAVFLGRVAVKVRLSTAASSAVSVLTTTLPGRLRIRQRQQVVTEQPRITLTGWLHGRASAVPLTVDALKDNSPPAGDCFLHAVVDHRQAVRSSLAASHINCMQAAEASHASVLMSWTF
jgi:hypothetical protein